MAEITHPYGLSLTTEEGLAAAEQALGVRFSEDYRRFLLEHNGGAPTPNAFFLGRVTQFALVDCFFAIDYLVSYFEEFRDEFQKGFVPIGIDPGGNMLLMDLRKDGESKVYYYDCCRAFEQSTDDGNTYLAAESFTDLLGRLQPLPEEV